MARVDFAWPELGAFVEFDGMVKYLRLGGRARRSRTPFSERSDAKS